MCMHIDGTTQLTFIFGGFLGQNVALERLTTLYCSTWTYAKALFGRTFRLHFWHNISVLRQLLFI